MPDVFRGLVPLPRNPAPSLSAMNNEVSAQRNLPNQQPWNSTWSCAYDALFNYVLLFNDLTQIVRGWNNPDQAPVAIRNDALELVRLGYYYAWNVFLAVEMEKMVARVAVNPNEAPTAAENRFRSMWDDLLGWLAALETLLYGQQDAPGAMAMQADISNWVNVADNVATIPDIPRLGFMELYVRVIAPACGDINTLYQRLRALQFKLYYDNHDHKTAWGLPGVLFACSGANNGNFNFVITSSTDDWRDFAILDNYFVGPSRDARRAAQPVNPAIATPNFTANVVITCSNALFNVYNAGAGAASEQYRVTVINAWHGLGNALPNGTVLPAAPRWADHAAEHALPMKVGTFAIKGRCLRCQALFRYNVGHNQTLVAREQELRASTWPLPMICNRGFVCGEAMAHFYCNAARNAAAGAPPGGMAANH